MDNLYLRLLELRTALTNSAVSPDTGVSVLFAVRHELLRHYYALPPRQVHLCSNGLQDQFRQAQLQLQLPLAHLGTSNQDQFAYTLHALDVLELTASCMGA